MVIGYNSFVVQSVTLQELGVTENVDHLKGVEIIGRRMYFHLMWIPLFPLWHFWMIRKNGNEAMAPVEVLVRINEKQIKARTPWYTFIGLILAAVVGVYFYFNVL